ncbi:MAG: MOSC N-terminal beta barrel domain-containing protein, partial [Candidatus Limnocylindrales bacterium]
MAEIGSGALVQWLARAPVKAMALAPQEEVRVGPGGIVGDRAFLLIDPDDRLVAGKRFGRLATIVPTVGHDPDTIALRFPDGSVVGGPAELGTAVGAVLYGDTRPTHEV